jgi:ribosomal protein S18 acetylase RimI-like enzyme
MENVTIRQVIGQDLDASYRVESQCFLPSEAASKEKIEKRIRIFPQGFLVAEFEGTVVGHVNSGATNKEDITDEAFKDMVGHSDDGKNLVIFSLAVLPEYQKQGIAQQLMLRFIEEAKRCKRQKILLICKADLIAYYQKYGFMYGGKSDSVHGGFDWHEMLLSLL